MGALASRVRADQIKEALYGRHVRRERPDIFLTEVKTGPTVVPGWGDLFRLDALAITPSWSNPCLTGYEVKVSRSDFLADEKWPAYLGYCHKFYFACPSQMIQPEELPEQVGLVWYNPETAALSTRRKAVHRPTEIPWAILYYIIISKFDRERHPFFSDRRAFLAAYVADKEERRHLGYHVGTKMAQEIKRLEKEREELQHKAERLEHRIAEADELRKLLADMGINISRWRWRDDLRDRLTAGVGADVRRQVLMMAELMEKLRQLVEGRPEAEMRIG